MSSVISVLIQIHMFTTAPLFGRFHSPLKQALAPLRQQPLHHIEHLLQDRIAPALLELNPDKANSRCCPYFPKLTFLSFLNQTLNPDSSCRSAALQTNRLHGGKIFQ